MIAILEDRSVAVIFYPGHGADVVLVTVRDDNRLNLGPPAMQETGVWKNLLHAQVCEAAGHRYDHASFILLLLLA